VIGYLLWKKDKKEASSAIQYHNSGNMVVVHFHGDDNAVTIPENVHLLSKSSTLVESVKTLVAPVSEANGIEKETFIHDNKEELKVDQKTAGDLRQVHTDDSESEPQTFTAHITLRAPILDATSKYWKFTMDKRVRNFDISETSIAKDAAERGGVNFGDTYKARIEMVEKKTKKGSYDFEYKVKEVLEFTPGNRAQQSTMQLEENDESQGSPETK
jgi:hypothetical protein